MFGWFKGLNWFILACSGSGLIQSRGWFDGEDGETEAAKLKTLNQNITNKKMYDKTVYMSLLFKMLLLFPHIAYGHF